MRTAILILALYVGDVAKAISGSTSPTPDDTLTLLAGLFVVFFIMDISELMKGK